MAGTPVPLDKPLPPLGKYLLGVAIALDTQYTGHQPDIDPKTATGQQADDYMNDRTARIYPGSSRTLLTTRRYGGPGRSCEPFPRLLPEKTPSRAAHRPARPRPG